MNAATVLPGFLRSLPPLSLLGDQTFATALRSTQRRTYARDHRIVESGRRDLARTHTLHRGLVLVAPGQREGAPVALDHVHAERLQQGLPEGIRMAWKNFYDEDTPTFTPEETSAIEPQPWFVSYQ